MSALTESLSKHGFGGLDTPEKLNEFLRRLNFSGPKKSFRQRIEPAIKQYLTENMSHVRHKAGQKYIITRKKMTGIEEIEFRRPGTAIASGSYNSIYMGTLRSNIGDMYQQGEKMVVKVCKNPYEIVDNFLELFIHAVLSIYQYRVLKNKSSILVSPFVLTSYNPDTREYMTLLEPITGDLNELVRSKSHEAGLSLARGAIFSLACGLAPIQNTFKFMHNDNHSENVFYKLVTSRHKFYLADFGFSRIELFGNLICAGSFNNLAQDIGREFVKSKDLMHVAYDLSGVLDNTDFNREFKIDSIEQYVIDKQLAGDQKHFSFYYPRAYPLMRNLLFQTFEPENMIRHFEKTHGYQVSHCKNMVGDEWYKHLTATPYNIRLIQFPEYPTEEDTMKVKREFHDHEVRYHADGNKEDYLYMVYTSLVYKMLSYFVKANAKALAEQKEPHKIDSSAQNEKITGLLNRADTTFNDKFFLDLKMQKNMERDVGFNEIMEPVKSNPQLPVKGGSINTTTRYHKKYLKYKAKYLNLLKNNQR